MILARFNGRYDNFGDILIFKNLLEELVKYDKVYLLGRTVTGIDTPSLRFRQAWLLSVKNKFFNGERILLIDPPGSRLISRNTRQPGVLETFRQSIVSIMWQIVGAKYYVTGISIDSAVNKKRYQHYQKIGVRDYNSLRKLEEAGIDASFCPDMACLSSPRLREWSRQDVLVSLRRETPDNGYAQGYAQELEEALPVVLKALNNVSAEFFFYAQVLEDQDYNRLLSSKMGENINCQYLEIFPSLTDYRETFQRCKFVVSNRLHVLLPAMSEGAVPIALISKGHSKIVNLLTSYGFEHNIVYVDGDQPIETQLASLLDGCEELRKTNYQRLLELSRLAEVYIKDMIEQ